MSPSISRTNEDLGGTETILLVEDNEPVRRLMHGILVQSGYRVLVAPDGQDALKVCQDYAGRIDLVLSDVIMPGLSGPDMMGHISEMRPEARVLFMSGYAETDGSDLHSSYDNHLAKPFTPAGLLDKVREVLRR